MTKSKLVGERLMAIVDDAVAGDLCAVDAHKEILALFKSIMPEEIKETLDSRTVSYDTHDQDIYAEAWNAYRAELIRRYEV